MTNRTLLVATVLILVGTIMAILVGLMDLLTKTTTEGQLSGFYLFGCGIFFTPIALFPFRKGEKWAWFTALISGGIALVGQLILTFLAGSDLPSFALPAAAFLVALWAIAMVLPVKQIFK